MIQPTFHWADLLESLLSVCGMLYWAPRGTGTGHILTC